MASDLRPALIGSAALHLSLLAATLVAWPHLARPIATTPVAVKLVATAPVADVRPAVEAPEPAPAAAPEPAPEPPQAQAAPPTPIPPTPVLPAPEPPRPAPPPPPKPSSLDLDKLAAKPRPQLDLNKLAKADPKLDLNRLASRPQPALDLNKLAARAPKGPPRPEQAPQARTAAGAAKGLSADEASLLAAKLNRLWNPNCGAEGANALVVRVDIRLTEAGTLAAPPALIGGQTNDPLWQAAAQRALSAVARGAPYDELPRDRYAVWKDIVFNFNGRQACGGG